MSESWINPKSIETLKKLRRVYLSEDPSVSENYWQDREVLDVYDATLAQRIAWKWEAVIEELKSRSLLDFPEKIDIIDWACGSGIASRTLLKHLPAQNIFLHDRSELAMDFAKEKIHKEFNNGPKVHLGLENLIPPPQSTASGSFRIFILSHVIGELNNQALGKLLSILKTFADAVIWVEGGSHGLAQKLSQTRDTLKSHFLPLAPCTHIAACPALEAKNKNHWCHFFAKTPDGLLNDAEWIDLAQELKIDLRSLPYSFLFLMNKRHRQMSDHLSKGHRAIGRPRVYKGYLKIQTCSSAHGLDDFRLQKRDNPLLFKELSKGKEQMPYLWTNEGQEISPAGGQ